MNISFTSRYFTWREALLLPSWGIEAEPTAEQAREIALLSIRMDKVREILGVPLRVTSWLRPNVPGRGDYNAHIGGAPSSMHKIGAAVDVVPIGKSVRRCFHEIEPFLTDLGLRMESINEEDGSHDRRLHFDTKTVTDGQRVFVP